MEDCTCISDLDKREVFHPYSSFTLTKQARTLPGDKGGLTGDLQSCLQVLLV